MLIQWANLLLISLRRCQQHTFYQDAIHVIQTILQDRDITNYLPSDFGGKLFQSLQEDNSNRETFSIDFYRLMRDIYNPLLMKDL